MVDYTVSTDLTLKDGISPALTKMLDLLDRSTRALSAFQEKLDKIGSAGINRLLKSLEKLENARFPGQLADGAERFDRLLAGADDKMAALARHAAETVAALDKLKDIRVPTAPAAPGGGRAFGGRGGGHAGGDPIMAGIEGGAVLEFLGGNYDRYSTVDQTYRAMQSDTRLAGNSPAMKAMRDQAADQLAKYRTLKPLDVAKNASEAYTLGGGEMSEQPAIANMLDRIEQALALRGKTPEEAQSEATAVVRGLDISNQFFSKKTGQFDQATADASATRVLALINASGGLTKGQNFLAFEKSAGLAGQRLSAEGEARLAHFVEINPSRSGTALRSFESLFGGHATRMTKKDKAAWTSAGLYDKSGMLVDNDQFYADPLAWVEKHQRQLTPDRINDRVQRQTVSSLLAEANGSQGNINRGAAAVARNNPDGNSDNLLKSPRGATLQFEASLEKFRTALGRFEAGPGAMILDKLATGLDKLTTIMSAHPEASENLLKLTAALAAFAVVRGAASLLGIGEGVGALSKGLSLLGKGSAAGAALETITATAGAGSLFGLAGGIVALGAALISLPPFLRYIFGDKDGSPHRATDARGHATAPSQDPTAPTYSTTPQQDMAKWFHDQWMAAQHPTSRNAKGIAYRTSGADPVHMQPIALTISLDGRVLSDTVTRHQTMQASRPSAAGSAPDPMEVALRPGTPYVSI